LKILKIFSKGRKGEGVYMKIPLQALQLYKNPKLRNNRAFQGFNASLQSGGNLYFVKKRKREKAKEKVEKKEFKFVKMRF
jgi:hypothetical protein